MKNADLIYAEYLTLTAEHSQAVEEGSDEAVQMVRKELRELLRQVEEAAEVYHDGSILVMRILRLSDGQVYAAGAFWLHKLKFHDTWTWTFDLSA